ncbi:CBS domain-containing protein, partial [Peptostreptococcus porci]
MNILFFLTPKSEVVHVLDTDEIREVLRKLKSHKFSSIPILNKDGNYLGTVKEGDLLWFLESAQTFSDTVLNTNIMEIPRRLTNETVKVDTNVEDLFTALISQNFVPVIDDSNI